MSNEPSPEQLAALQKTHIEFLEHYYDNIIVAGVPILRCINYKTLQVINNAGLKYLLKGADDAKDTSIE